MVILGRDHHVTHLLPGTDKTMSAEIVPAGTPVPLADPPPPTAPQGVLNGTFRVEVSDPDHPRWHRGKWTIHFEPL